jgi:hypothetical protein
VWSCGFEHWEERLRYSHRMVKGATIAFGMAMLACPVACSLLTSYDGFTGNEAGASDGTAGAACIRLPGATDCQPAIQGWTGPELLFEGATGSMPQCPGGALARYVGHADLDASPPTCTACACGEPSASCTPPTLHSFPSSGCPADIDLPAALSVNECDTAGTLAESVYVAPSTPVVQCAASGGAKTVPVAGWTRTAVVCDPATDQSASCPAGDRCVLPPSPPLTGFCMFEAGDVSCPLGTPYATKHTYYGGVADGRTCASCKCAPPGATCDFGSDDLLLYPNSTTCSGASTPLQPGSCEAVLPDTASIKFQTAPNVVVAAGGCSASGGQPTGMATPAMPTTVCCM